MHGVVPLSYRAFHQAVLPVVDHVTVAAAQIPARRRFPKGLDFVDITDAQSSVRLQGIPAVRLFLVPLQKIAHADASLSQQGLAWWKRGPRQHVHSVEVTDAVDALALHRSRYNVHPVKVADTHAAVTLQRRLRQDVHPVEVADAHAAVPLQRPGEDVRPIEVTDTHATFTLQRRPGQDVHTVELVSAGSTLAMQQSRRLDRPEGPQRVTVALVLVVLRARALRVHQRLQIERAFGPPGRLLAGRYQRRARAHEHAVLAQPGGRPGSRDAAHLVHRMLHAVDVEL